MSTILITGGTGLVGTALTAHLTANGHQVIILSRTKKDSKSASISYAVWDVAAQTIDRNAIAAADFIVHLAGAGVADKRWTEARKKEIVESRTQSAALIVKALKEIPNKVKAVISASAIGYYGDDKKKLGKRKAFVEDMPADDSFLGSTCVQWEEGVKPIEAMGKRLVIYRTGIVLSNDGGAFPEFKTPLKFGIAGLLGGGKQMISWIHIDDLCRMFLYAIENESMSGTFNAVAPNPVTNKELTLELAQRIRGSFYIPMHVPAFVLELALGGMSIEVLKSTTVSADKIRTAGFQFLYPAIETALNELTKKTD